MDTRHTLHGINFVWNDRKATLNRQKHGVIFELACEAFFDPFLHYVDEEVVGNELRETIIGMTSNSRILLVVYVLRHDIVRIVTARLVTKVEREQYENQ